MSLLDMGRLSSQGMQQMESFLYAQRCLQCSGVGPIMGVVVILLSDSSHWMNTGLQAHMHNVSDHDRH